MAVSTSLNTVNQALRQWPTWPIYPIGFVPVVWIYWLGATGQLGIEPIEKIEHSLGLWGLWLLMATLAISPVRKHLGLNLMRFRRAVGLVAFYYILVHVLTWAVLDVQSVGDIGKDILKRPYITIGMGAFLLILPLALSSTDWSIRKIGSARWRRLHRLVYPAILLGTVHFVMLRKGWQLEPLIYLGIAVLLLVVRAPGRRRSTSS